MNLNMALKRPHRRTESVSVTVGNRRFAETSGKHGPTFDYLKRISPKPVKIAKYPTTYISACLLNIRQPKFLKTPGLPRPEWTVQVVGP